MRACQAAVGAPTIPSPPRSWVQCLRLRKAMRPEQAKYDQLSSHSSAKTEPTPPFSVDTGTKTVIVYASSLIKSLQVQPYNLRLVSAPPSRHRDGHSQLACSIGHRSDGHATHRYLYPPSTSFASRRPVRSAFTASMASWV